MQISYHSALTKIQKLQNFKKKKHFSVHGRYCWYLNRYETLIFRYRYTYRYGTYWLVRLVPVQYWLPWLLLVKKSRLFINNNFFLFIFGGWDLENLFGFLFPLFYCLFLIHYFLNSRLFPNLYKNASTISLGDVRCENFVGFFFFERKIFKLLRFLLLLSFFSCSFLTIFQFKGSSEKKPKWNFIKRAVG